MLQKSIFPILAAALMGFAVIAGPALAQDRPVSDRPAPDRPVSNPDASVNPTASAVHEDQLFRELDRVTGRVSIPDRKAGTLEQPAGREWRELHQVTIPKYGAYGLLGMLVALALFYIVRGRVRLERGWSGIKVLRFNRIERFVHWFTATCFIILGLTGLNVVFGRTALLPLIGEANFSLVTQYGKYLHNFLGIPFTAGIVFMYLMWLWDNILVPSDWTWIKSGGGLVGKAHPRAKKFNFGQKLIFWSVVGIGGALSVTGLMLLFPFYEAGIAQMQGAQLIHSIGGLVLIAIIFAHIYIGTLGMEGAFDAMGTGKVDLNWAREHHSAWAENAQVVDDSRPPDGAAVPAE